MAERGENLPRWITALPRVDFYRAVRRTNVFGDVDELVIDVVEPFFRVLVELGYDRSIDPWAPTPARLIPTNLDPAEVVTDLVNAIGEGATNAAAPFGAPAPSSSSTDADDAALAQVSAAPETGIAGISAKAGSPEPQGDLTESTEPDEVKVSNEGSVQQDAVETSTDGAKFEPSVDERKPSARNSAVNQPQLFGRPTSQKLVDRGLAPWRTGNVAVPRKNPWGTIEGDGKSAAEARSTLTTAGSSAAADSADSTSPDDADS